jgi:hypothetical protein
VHTRLAPVFRKLWSKWEASKRSDARAKERDRLRQIHSFVTRVMDRASQEEAGAAGRLVRDPSDELDVDGNDTRAGYGDERHNRRTRGLITGSSAKNDQVRRGGLLQTIFVLIPVLRVALSLVD